jgi:hypothetical protein
MAGLAVPLFRAWGADSLIVTFDGDNLHVSSPDLHFLNGKPLARLKEGSTVWYVARLTLFRDAYVTPWKHSDAKFELSYDVLAEDHFEVAVPGPPPRRALVLSQAAAEAWCLDKIWIAAADLLPDRQFWLQLELGTLNQKDLSSILGETGIRIDLIDVFSRPGADPPVVRQKGPLRLADLARKGRG